MTDLGQVADRLAIRELLDRYCDGVNQRDAERWGSSWAEESFWEIPHLEIKNEGKEMTAEQLDLVRKPILDKYEKEGHPYFASARLWDDGVIQPTDTRRVLIQALKAVKYNPVPDQNFPVFRM